MSDKAKALLETALTRHAAYGVLLERGNDVYEVKESADESRDALARYIEALEARNAS